MSKSLFNKIVAALVIGFLLIITPQNINLPNQSSANAIVTGIALDKESASAPDISLTAQILLPMAGGQYTQSMTLVTSEGKNLMEAFYNLEALVGKKINLAHCFYIIIGNEFSYSNLAKEMDYLIRGNNSGTNTMFLQSSKTAKELIEIAAKATSSGVDSIQTLLKYNDIYLASKESNLKSFYNDYLSPHKTSIVTLLNFENVDSGNSGSSESGSNGGSSGSSESIVKTKIKNDGSCAVYFNGTLATTLDSEKRKHFNWLDYRLKDIQVELNEVTDEDFKDATVGYTIISKSQKYTYKFINNKPCIFIDYKLNLRAEMFMQDETLPDRCCISETIKQKFNTLVESEVNKAMSIQKYYGFDIFNFYKGFNINCHREWQNYLDTLEDKKDYMKNIEIFTKVECYSRV